MYLREEKGVGGEAGEAAERLTGVMVMGSADIGVSVGDKEVSPALGSFFQSCAKVVPSE